MYTFKPTTTHQVFYKIYTMLRKFSPFAYPHIFMIVDKALLFCEYYSIGVNNSASDVDNQPSIVDFKHADNY